MAVKHVLGKHYDPTNNITFLLWGVRRCTNANSSWQWHMLGTWSTIAEQWQEETRSFPVSLTHGELSYLQTTSAC